MVFYATDEMGLCISILNVCINRFIYALLIRIEVKACVIREYPDNVNYLYFVYIAGKQAALDHLRSNYNHIIHTLFQTCT